MSITTTELELYEIIKQKTGSKKAYQLVCHIHDQLEEKALSKHDIDLIAQRELELIKIDRKNAFYAKIIDTMLVFSLVAAIGLLIRAIISRL